MSYEGRPRCLHKQITSWFHVSRQAANSSQQCCRILTSGGSLQGFAVWEGDTEEADSIDDIVSRLAENSDDRECSRDGEPSGTTDGQGKGDLISRKPTFSWRDFGPSRTRQKD